MKKSIGIAMATFLVATSAWADGSQPSAATPLFDGFYGGLSLGTGDASGNLNADTILGSSSTSFDSDSETAFGGFVGYNLQSDMFVYGVEAQYSSLGDIESLNVDIEDAWDLRAKAGIQNGNFLFYGSLGWSWTTVSNPTQSGKTIDGMNYGVGVEYQASGPFFIAADYIRRDVDGGVSDSISVDVDVDTLSIRAGYRF